MLRLAIYCHLPPSCSQITTKPRHGVPGDAMDANPCHRTRTKIKTKTKSNCSPCQMQATPLQQFNFSLQCFSHCSPSVPVTARSRRRSPPTASHHCQGKTRLEEKMRIVGLTGGIASGKSTVSNLFKANDIPVVDADLIARDVLKKGTGGWKRVVKAFGQEILQDDGEVDRAKLGQIVFSDSGKRQLLNRLLAPFISSGILWEVFKLWMKGSQVIVLDIPLLFEAKLDRWTKPIIVVWVDPETQLRRLMARDGISEDQARNRINAQMALDWKRTKADIIIDNSGSLEGTRERFQEVLIQVTRSLTWVEFGLSRAGAIRVLVSITVGVIACRTLYNSGGMKSK